MILRKKLIKAIVGAIISDRNQDHVEEVAAEALDAILDTLEANADEWTDAAEATTQPNFPLFAECFIAALRDSDTGPS